MDLQFLKGVVVLGTMGREIVARSKRMWKAEINIYSSPNHIGASLKVGQSTCVG